MDEVVWMVMGLFSGCTVEEAVLFSQPLHLLFQLGGSRNLMGKPGEDQSSRRCRVLVHWLVTRSLLLLIFALHVLGTKHKSIKVHLSW